MLTNRNLSVILAAMVVGFLAGCAENPGAPATAIAATLEPFSPTLITAMVGTGVTERPTVVARDEKGIPIARVPVLFTLVLGNGSIFGASLFTDAAGSATLGGWILSRTAGPNVVAATMGTSRVEFSATGFAGPPAVVLKNSDDNQLALPGFAVPVPPAVLIRDAYDNPVSGVGVTFAITAGGGWVTDPTVMTNSDGIAQIGAWTIGQEGPQSVQATVAGIAPVIFSATPTDNLCSIVPDLVIGSSATFDLSATDCAVPDGRLSDLFSFRATAGGYTFNQTSANFDSNLALMTKSGVPVAEAGVTGIPGNAALKVILVGGEYVLRATSRVTGVFGEYTLASAVAAESVTSCEEAFVMPGVRTSQMLSGDDCGALPTQPRDHYRIYLRAGTKVTVTISTTQLDTRLELVDSKGRLVAYAEENVPNTLDSRVVFTPVATGYYLIRAISQYGRGEYTLTVD